MASNDVPLILNDQTLLPEDIEAVACSFRTVGLSDDARRKIQSARKVVDRCANDQQPVYGVNTGFGSLSTCRIDPQDVIELQRNLVRSHAAGVGQPLPNEVVRAMMLVLAASLARGNSGVREVVVERLIDFLNRGVTPLIPSRGSVGASGDLAPLAHLALVLIGEGKAHFNGTLYSGKKALEEAGIEPLVLQAKEGIALLNGTHLMTAIGALALCDLHRIKQAAVVSAAMAIDACRATDTFLDDRLHVVRGQIGPRRIATQLRQLLSGSQILPSHKTDDPRVQDPYCLRAAPQVMGAADDLIDFIDSAIQRELGAVTDNPLIFVSDENGGGDIVSGANFHGMPIAIALDLIPLALSHLAGIAERRIYWLLAASDGENPVNAHLSPQPGLHSGMMIVQYTAAACCNELQTLAAPATVANIPTCAGIEDYNSMGATAAHQAQAAIDLAMSVIAAELLVMTEALEYHRPLKSGNGVERAFSIVRDVVPRLTKDRPPAPDIATIETLIRTGRFESLLDES